MQGSEKQIKWAEKIRETNLPKILEMKNRAEQLILTHKDPVESEKWSRRGWDLEKCLSELRGCEKALAQTTAGWWIENRNVLDLIKVIRTIKKGR